MTSMAKLLADVMRKEFAAAITAAKKQIPFALFAFPGSDNFRFFANPGGEMTGCSYFLVNRWNTSYEESLRIYEEMDADKLLESVDSLVQQTSRSPLQSCSTSRERYVEKLTELISRLKKRGGKTVFSRIIAQENVNLDLGQLLETQFESFPDTFRFFYYTPETGLWLGTSPELLMEYEPATRRFATMSLAGTRVSDSAAWDQKNIHEQNLVAEFVSKVLADNNAEFSVERCRDVHFKPVCHICDMFRGILPSNNVSDILNQLSPTPALSGFPVETAIDEISELEEHDRECYGGYVGYVTPEELKLFVNLRSAKLTESGYCVFAGGGITAQSDSAVEWLETENKTMILRKNISKALR